MWKKLKAHPWWLLAGIVLLALAMWGAYSFWFAKAPQPPLITAAVERGDIERRRERSLEALAGESDLG